MDVSKPISSNYGYFQEKYGAGWESLIETLRGEFGDDLEKTLKPGTDKTDLPVFFIKKDASHRFLKSLKEKHQFSFLTDMTATDEDPSDGEPRFHLVFHLMSVETKSRVRVKIKVAEDEKVPTFIPIWPGANWAEREIFDMFGIQFEGHPDLRRILMDVRWEGHPLRKDYPLRGYQVFLTPEPIDPELLK